MTTWTATFTATVGQIFTAAQWNMYVRDNLAAVNDVIFLRPQDFTIQAGAPDLSQDLTNGYVPAWKFDPGSQEEVTSTALIPKSWTACDVYVWWTVAGGAGNVRWGTDISQMGDGTGNTGATSATQLTATAPSAGVPKKTTVQSSVSVTAGNICKVALVRVAADAADTLATDAAVIGIELRRVA